MLVPPISPLLHTTRNDIWLRGLTIVSTFGGCRIVSPFDVPDDSKDSHATPHEDLRSKFEGIFNSDLRRDLATFLAKALSSDPNSQLSYSLKKKLEKDRHKSGHVKSWLDLDPKEMLDVLADRYEFLKVGDKDRHIKKCIERMRDIRNEVAHPTGEIDFHGLYNDTRLLERFAVFIQAGDETIAEIHELTRRLKNELERLAGIRTHATSRAPEESVPKVFQPSGIPFEDIAKLLSDHEAFIGRSKIITRIRDFIEGRASGTLIIEAEPGTGKSALIAHCIRREFNQTTPRPVRFIYHRSEGMTDPAVCIRTLYDQLVEVHGLDQAAALEPTDDARRLRTKLEVLLVEHVAPKLGDGKQLVFIDGLDEAGVDKDLTSYQALPSRLPKGIIVVATTRHIPARSEILVRREDVERLNLNSTDFNFENGKDAKAFVASRLVGKIINATVQDEICRIGGGNFLVLRELCRWVDEKLPPNEVPGFLKRLATEAGSESGILHGLYEEFWRRLPQQKLDTIGEVAGLLLAIQGRATASLCVEALDAGLTKWETAIDAMAEYLRPRAEEDGSASYRFYHQSFADYLLVKIKPFVERAHKRLGDVCLRWPKLSGDVRYYAVRFGPEHLCLTENWPELEKLLTDLEFVEEKCRLGMVQELVIDYQLASQHHIEWVQANQSERHRRDILDKWSADVMATGQQWSKEVRAAWQSHDLATARNQFKWPYSFPDPPDTSELCELLRGRGGAELLEKHCWSPSVTNLESYRAFVMLLAASLEQYPDAVARFAVNCQSPGTLSKDAEDLLSRRDTVWMQERPKIDLGVGMIPLRTISIKASAFAMSPDGRYGATGEANGDVRLWDLSTGKCLCHCRPAHQDQVAHIFLSVDGNRIVSASESGSILLHDRNGRELGNARVDGTVTGLDASPDGEIVAVACRGGIVHLFDAGADKCLIERQPSLTHSELTSIEWVRIWPEGSRVIAGGEGRSVAAWDLITGKLYKFTASVATEEPTDEPSTWANILAFRKGQFLQLGLGGISADGRIALHDGVDLFVDGEEVEEDYYINQTTDVSLTADGRVVWGCYSTALWGFDLLRRDATEEIEDRPMWWEPGYSQLKGAGTLDELFGTEAGDPTTRVLCSHVAESAQNCEIMARQERDFYLAVPSAYTPDFRLGIKPDYEASVDSDGLYRIPLPENDAIGSVQVSPCGQRAFVSLESHWFVWNIGTGERIASHRHDSSNSSVVLPDWMSVASISDGKLGIFELLTGAPSFSPSEHICDKHTRIQVTNDGRTLIVNTASAIRVWRVTNSQLVSEWNISGVSDGVLSPDARYLACTRGDRIEVYNLATKKLVVSQPCLHPLYDWRDAQFQTDGTIVVDIRNQDTPYQGREYQLQLRFNRLPDNEQWQNPFVTATRVLRYHPDNSEILTAFHNGLMLPGKLDVHLTAACVHCGKRTTLPVSVEEAIDAVRDSYDLPVDKSPCLMLPVEAWDNEALTCRSGQLRLNPFVA